MPSENKSSELSSLDTPQREQITPKSKKKFGPPEADVYTSALPFGKCGGAAMVQGLKALRFLCHSRGFEEHSLFNKGEVAYCHLISMLPIGSRKR